MIIIVKYMYSSTAEVTECEGLYLTIHFLKVSVFLCYEYKELSVPTLASDQPVLCHCSDDCLAFFNPIDREEENSVREWLLFDLTCHILS